MITLGVAAKQTGLSRTTLSRAIKSGELIASKREDNWVYEIDPENLSRFHMRYQMKALAAEISARPAPAGASAAEVARSWKPAPEPAATSGVGGFFERLFRPFAKRAAGA